MKNTIELQWGILCNNLNKTRIGLNRKTYRIDSNYWLSLTKKEFVQGFWTEMDTLSMISKIKDKHLVYPCIVPTLSGKNYYEDNEWYWRVISHVEGNTPDPCDLSVYETVCIGLAQLHLDLKKISQTAIRAYPSIYTTLQENIEVFQKQQNAFNFCKPQQQIIQKTIDSYGAFLQQINTTHRQWIHGDFCFPNIKTASGTVGVLDLEFVSFDSCLWDLANLYLTLLLRSEATRQEINLTIDKCLNHYEAETSRQINKDLLIAATFLMKVDSCFYHQKKWLYYEDDLQTVERQFEQLNKLWRMI